MSSFQHPLNEAQFDKLYQQSIKEPDLFWEMQAKHYLHWTKPWDNLMGGDYFSPPINWFSGGELNICYNAIDRHLKDKANDIAIIWEGNEVSEHQFISYQSLYEHVCQMTNLFISLGIEKGDTVCIYMPSVPEAVYAMLACARIGAIHNVIFGGFSPESTRKRIQNSKAKLVVTVNSAKRGDKLIEFKKNIDISLENCESVTHVLVVQRLNTPCAMQETRDIYYHEVIPHFAKDCPITVVEANHPLFILYTSGSTGEPKGILHRSAGYALYAAITYDYLFNHKHPHRHWSTADIGWITGHSYQIYGPLLLGTSTLLYEGVPNYPDYSRFWQIIDKYQINNFYTAPTVLRTLRLSGEAWINPYKLDSLKILGSVGEPLNPEVHSWFKAQIGKHKCPIINTWWQTETGGALLTTFPGFQQDIPGSVGKPFLGIVPSITDNNMLYIAHPWPGMMLDIHQNTPRFIKDYLSNPEDGYLAGDAACIDEFGHYHIQGRLDDVINVSGHRIGSGELENALLTHQEIAEAAVIGIPHPIKGESIMAFIIAFDQQQDLDNLNADVQQHIKKTIGGLAVPDDIIWVSRLPKTRSGKIMRRLLKHIALGKLELLGDLSTLAEPQVIEEIVSCFKFTNQ
ncbi:MAG: acetate--CoA ligase [Gammaproteobacteria bacterium]|nr:acetate--CoA ligase [Gammaproteobacteria bacterium]